MSETICRWSDKVKCEQSQISADNLNKAKPLPRELIYCAECMLKQAITYLEGYDKLDFTFMSKKIALEYSELTKNAKILQSQWGEYWKKQEERRAQGLR